MNSKTLMPLLVAAALWPLTNATLVQAQVETVQSSKTSVQIAESSDLPQAVVIVVKGTCEYSEDGRAFAELKADHILYQGVVVRTGEAARADLFFRRIGTTVRLQPNTEMKLEKMTRSTNKEGLSEMHTLLDLRKGRIFTVVRSFVAGCTLEIRNAAGRSVVEGTGLVYTVDDAGRSVVKPSGSGRYIITADGTHVADKTSLIPLKVIGETGITVIAPGQSFRAKEGKMLPVDAPETVLTLIEWDELRALADSFSPPPAAK